MGYAVTLITNPSSDLSSSKNLEVIKVASLSKSDRNQEFFDTKAQKNRFRHVVGVLGLVFDTLFKFFAGAKSDGKWSWVITGIPPIVKILRRNNFDYILVTGGPSSAHVAAVAAAKLMHQRAILEFQDPFIPEMAQMSVLAKWSMRKIEEWLVKNCEKYVTVSSQAATTVQRRYPDHRSKITSCLPGSPIFQLSEKSRKSSQGTPIIFTHLGTLYGSRNLDNFATAIDQLRAQGLLGAGNIRTLNVGPDGTNAFRGFEPEDFRVIGRTERLKGLSLASDSDFLLLVQHSDSRSLETIPHKTYDYLNLQIPIFGLVMNEELKKIIEDHFGYVADPRDVEQIKLRLMEAVTDHRTGRKVTRESQISFMHQLHLLLA